MRSSVCCPQVGQFLDAVEGQPAARGALQQHEACTDAVKQQLRNMLSACESASSNGKEDKGAGTYPIVCTAQMPVAATRSYRKDFPISLLDSTFIT